ncbi:hypothetical protein QBZ16_003021 [Prototheca wickerhamii]|uniref:Uncharacterized protein n=1 Tax=Prototheca wickerhamii TaxID=3111 RepID=A0AAD9ILD9_PROWI|nr:hypothetical protein QBZ16_003021 [Prototheca wickerhamii]
MADVVDYLYTNNYMSETDYTLAEFQERLYVDGLYEYCDLPLDAPTPAPADDTPAPAPAVAALATVAAALVML